MSHAVLIAGNARRFVDTAQNFRLYLVREKLVTPKKARLLTTVYVAEEMFAYRLSSAIAAKITEPLLIFFSGHGNELGWALDDVRIFSYHRLAKTLLAGRRPVTIVNDCCHAMAAVKEFKRLHVSPERLSFIAAAEAGETISGGIAEIVLNSWKQGRPVRFSSELRWGNRFDDHYYSSSAVK